MKKKIDLVDKEHNSEKWKSGSFDDESGNKLKRQRWKMFWVVFPKRANVTPVFKADSKDVVENYRSISLLSIPSKCQERIVYNALYPHVAPYLTDWQHRFVRGRSCATLNEGKQMDVVFLRFAKAFSGVAHNILLQKIGQFWYLKCAFELV